MKLSQVLQQARTGELDTISKKAKPDETIVGYINLALIVLYARFQLATEEAIIHLRPDITKTVYTLGSGDLDVSVAGQRMADDEFMSIVAAYNEDGTEIKVNDEKDPYSIMTVSYNQVQIPLLKNNSYVSIIYRKNPPFIKFTENQDASLINVPIPVQLLEALLHYVGYRAHGAMNGSVSAENNTHLMRFEAACRRAEELGVLTPDDMSNYGVTQKGFV